MSLIIEATSNLACGAQKCCGDPLWRFTFLQVDGLHVFHNCNGTLLVNAEDTKVRYNKWMINNRCHHTIRRRMLDCAKTRRRHDL